MVETTTPELARQLSRTCAALIGTQSRALVLERQARLDPGDDDLLHAVTTAQDTLGEASTDYLSRIMPAAITDLLSPHDRLNNLAKAVEEALPPPGAVTPDQGEKLIKTIRVFVTANQAGRGRIAQVSADVIAWHAHAAEAAQALETAITAELGALKGKEGQIARVQRAISAKREDIDTTIDEIIGAADKIGERAGELATGALTYISSGRSKPKPKPGKGGPPPEEAGEETPEERRARRTAREQQAREEGAKAVEAIKGGKKSTQDLGGAFAKLAQANDTLADLYFELAELNLRATWARAIADQARSLLRAAKSVELDARTLAECWSSLLDPLRTQVEAAEASGDVADLRHAWARFHQEHIQLTSRLPAIRNAMSAKTALVAL